MAEFEQTLLESAEVVDGEVRLLEAAVFDNPRSDQRLPGVIAELNKLAGIAARLRMLAGVATEATVDVVAEPPVPPIAEPSSVPDPEVAQVQLDVLSPQVKARLAAAKAQQVYMQRIIAHMSANPNTPLQSADFTRFDSVRDADAAARGRRFYKAINALRNDPAYCNAIAKIGKKGLTSYIFRPDSQDEPNQTAGVARTELEQEVTAELWKPQYSGKGVYMINGVGIKDRLVVKVVAEVRAHPEGIEFASLFKRLDTNKYDAITPVKLRNALDFIKYAFPAPYAQQWNDEFVAPDPSRPAAVRRIIKIDTTGGSSTDDTETLPDGAGKEDFAANLA